MPRTHFHNFDRDDGTPITVEYSASGGEPDFDFPGHVCDGGGSGPEIVILDAWPRAEWRERISGVVVCCMTQQSKVGRVAALAVRPLAEAVGRVTDWWFASLSDQERERMEAWLAERHVEDHDSDPW